MSQPSEQDHWAKLALELGASVPEDVSPKPPSSDSLPEGVGLQEPQSPVGGSRAGASRPGSPASGVSPKPSPPADPARSAAHWLELAKQLGVEVPPEMQEPPSPEPEASAPSVAEKSAQELPTEKSPSEPFSERRLSGEKSGAEPRKHKKVLSQQPRSRSSEVGMPEAESPSESRGPASELRKKKRRRKKHRREKPTERIEETPLCFLSEQESLEPLGPEGSVELSSGRSGVGEDVEEGGLPSLSGPGPAEEAVGAPGRWDLDRPESSDFSPLPPEMSAGAPGEAAGAEASEASLVEGLAEPLGESLTPSGETWPGTAEPSGLGEPGEAILLPPPEAPRPTLCGQEELLGAGFLPESGAKPEEPTSLGPSFIESEEVPGPEDLFEVSEEVSEESEESEDEESSEADAMHSEKHLHHGVPTWKEVMDLIIAANMQNRSRRPDRGGSGRGGSSRSGH